MGGFKKYVESDASSVPEKISSILHHSEFHTIHHSGHVSMKLKFLEILMSQFVFLDLLA